MEGKPGQLHAVRYCGWQWGRRRLPVQRCSVHVVVAR